MKNVIPKKKMLHDIKCQYGTDWDNLEAEIRADEREETTERIIKGWDKLLNKARASEREKIELWTGTRYELLSKVTKEAYAKGKADAHTEMYEAGLKDGQGIGYKKRQVELIERLNDRFLEGSDLLSRDDIRKAIKLASECLGKGIDQPKGAPNPKPETRVLPAGKTVPPKPPVLAEPCKHERQTLIGDRKPKWICDECGESHEWRKRPRRREG